MRKSVLSGLDSGISAVLSDGITKARTRDWLEGELDAALTAIEALPGATSSSVYRVRAGQRTAVLRLLTNASWLAQEPDLAAHEAAVPAHVERCALPASTWRTAG